MPSLKNANELVRPEGRCSKDSKISVAYRDILEFTQEMRAASHAGESDALLQRFDAAIRKWYTATAVP